METKKLLDYWRLHLTTRAIRGRKGKKDVDGYWKQKKKEYGECTSRGVYESESVSLMTKLADSF